MWSPRAGTPSVATVSRHINVKSLFDHVTVTLKSFRVLLLVTVCGISHAFTNFRTSRFMYFLLLIFKNFIFVACIPCHSPGYRNGGHIIIIQ